MGNAIAFPTRLDNDSAPSQARTELPPPRVWTLDDLSRFFRVSKSWIYKRTEARAEDPIPRIPGIGRLAFDTWNPDFQAWVARQLGSVDTDQKR